MNDEAQDAPWRVEMGNPGSSIPVGLNELFLGVWLIVKGFNSSAIVSESA